MLYRHFASTRPKPSAALRRSCRYQLTTMCSSAVTRSTCSDARGVISVTDRTAHIARVRDLARKVARLYLRVNAPSAETDADTAGADAADSAAVGLDVAESASGDGAKS